MYRAQEVWWCSLGANVGVETDGKNEWFERPVLVFRKFSKHMFWGLPMTTKVQKQGPFYVSVSLFGEDQIVMLSQLRVLSPKRLIRRMGKLSDEQFLAVNRAFESFTQKTDPLRNPSSNP